MRDASVLESDTDSSGSSCSSRLCKETPYVTIFIYEHLVSTVFWVKCRTIHLMKHNTMLEHVKKFYPIIRLQKLTNKYRKKDIWQRCVYFDK